MPTSARPANSRVAPWTSSSPAISPNRRCQNRYRSAENPSFPCHRGPLTLPLVPSCLQRSWTPSPHCEIQNSAMATTALRAGPEGRRDGESIVPDVEDLEMVGYSRATDRDAQAWEMQSNPSLVNWAAKAWKLWICWRSFTHASWSLKRALFGISVCLISKATYAKGRWSDG